MRREQKEADRGGRGRSRTLAFTWRDKETKFGVEERPDLICILTRSCWCCVKNSQEGGPGQRLAGQLGDHRNHPDKG